MRRGRSLAGLKRGFLEDVDSARGTEADDVRHAHLCAFDLAVAVQPLRDRMRAAHVRDISTAENQRVITPDEVAQLKAAADAASAVIAVDDFAPEELSPRHASTKGDVSSKTTPLPPATAAE